MAISAREIGALSATVAPAELLQFGFSPREAMLGTRAYLLELLESRSERPGGCIANSTGLVKRERLGRRGGQRAGDAFGRARAAEVASVRFSFGGLFCEVEAGRYSRAAADDVAPFAKGALVAEEDVGALECRALGGVAGERVAMLELLGRVEGLIERRTPVSVRNLSPFGSSLMTVARMPLRTSRCGSLRRQMTDRRPGTRARRARARRGRGGRLGQAASGLRR